ncbi:hypothetical protein [Flavobacterium channae]|uniref:hypothetical protein n=1 Tax=Flavobacterium channae TaxID=2897181 RepID=UPI001E50E6F2|nr:hypothetical protein [Flavobacterium channae]UGS22916.1 hypothetical protein LOS89_09065 [Flavobacterium channae]
MNSKPAQYLDKILEILAKDFGKSFSIQEIQNELTPIELFGKKGNVLFSSDLLVDSQHAIEYLRKLDLVIISPGDGKVTLSYEGFMKIKTNSFSKEVRDKSANQFLQRLAWILPIIISLIALGLSLSKKSNEYKPINKQKFSHKHCIMKNIE